MPLNAYWYAVHTASPGEVLLIKEVLTDHTQEQMGRRPRGCQVLQALLPDHLFMEEKLIMPGTVLGAGGSKEEKRQCCPSQHSQILGQTQAHPMQGGRHPGSGPEPDSTGPAMGGEVTESTAPGNPRRLYNRKQQDLICT